MSIEKQERKKNPGFRLAVIFGVCSAIFWFFMMLSISRGFSDMGSKEWMTVIVGAVISFLLPFALIRGTLWLTSRSERK